MNTHATAFLKPVTGIVVLAVLAAGFGLRTQSAPAPKLKSAAKVKSAAKDSPIHLRLAAERRRTVMDVQGQPRETWMPLADGTPVQPGDTLRYTLRVENDGALAINNFVLTQPIPAGMIYQPGAGSVSGAEGVQTLFRVDGRTAYRAQPTIPVSQPDGTIQDVSAPAEAYRDVRWIFTQPILPAQAAQTVYLEKVR